MIDLSLYPKFEQDIQGKETSIYPVAVIGDDLFISTVKEHLAPNYFEDYGLKISNIKQSIEIEKRKFKISNVTLSLNNYEKDGVRISDLIS